jgi:predicted RNase H-like HicB family nuclease
MKIKLTAVFQKVPEGYIGFVEELPGANTQGATLEEAKANLQEAMALVLEANRMLAEETLQGQDVIREPFTIIGVHLSERQR